MVLLVPSTSLDNGNKLCVTELKQTTWWKQGFRKTLSFLQLEVCCPVTDPDRE